MCDLNSYVGASPFHQDFVDAADVPFHHDDATPDPVSWMRECVKLAGGAVPGDRRLELSADDG